MMTIKKPDGALEWITPEKLLLIGGWRKNGLSNEEVAKNIGISVRTLYIWKRKHPEIDEALKMGKVEANFLIENTLFSKARNGNLTAMIFWLKNNWRDKYSDTMSSPEDIAKSKKMLEIMEIDKQRKQKELDMLNGNAGGIEIKFVGLDDDQTDNT